ncbi:MAG: MoxR family ATPase [Thauera sp.]
MTDFGGNPFAALARAIASAADPDQAKERRARSLPATKRFPKAGHWWDWREIDALTFAWSARRPLLVRGEAGCGKSQIARAAAAALGEQEPLVEVIHPRFEALDLLYRVDSIERLADAQLQRLDPTNWKYVKAGALWQAMYQAERGATPVLLIDEIDKADADVPNALLEVLGNRSFTVPPLKNMRVSAEEGRMPLVIITTNEERELPAAFVRRCAVLNLNPPSSEKSDEPFIEWLVQRGLVHELQIDVDARRHAARQVLEDRKKAERKGYPKVGLAEYIDLLTAIQDLTESLDGDERKRAQTDWLNRLGAYGLVKNADQPQDRLPVAEEAKESPDLAKPAAVGSDGGS